MNELVIIDDDTGIAEIVTSYLEQQGYQARFFTVPEVGLDYILQNRVSLVLLDVMMPGMDGFALLENIRKESSVPVIMLTARGGLDDRVRGLDLGADDYLPKPFEPRELLARIQTVLRRTTTPQEQDTLEFDGLTLHRDRRTVLLDSTPVELSETEFEILLFLMENAGTPQSRDDISEYLKGIDTAAFDRSIDISVSRLRKKLHENPKKPRFIKTLYGAGYLFTGQKI